MRPGIGTSSMGGLSMQYRMKVPHWCEPAASNSITQ